MKNSILVTLLRDLFRKINYKFRHIVLKKIVRAETGRDFAVAMLKEIKAFPCSCELFVDHSGCPTCLATMALRDEILRDPQMREDDLLGLTDKSEPQLEKKAVSN